MDKLIVLIVMAAGFYGVYRVYKHFENKPSEEVKNPPQTPNPTEPSEPAKTVVEVVPIAEADPEPIEVEVVKSDDLPKVEEESRAARVMDHVSKPDAFTEVVHPTEPAILVKTLTKTRAKVSKVKKLENDTLSASATVKTPTKKRTTKPRTPKT